MELSIIIPVYGEIPAILPTLTGLLSLDIPLDTEVIVVDGDPARPTLCFIEEHRQALPRFPALKLVSSAAGRGIQMNAGAARARGRLLFFLHADTRVDQEGMDRMVAAWQCRASSLFCGAFDLTLDTPEFRFRVIEKTASFRSRLTRIPYGDQGIFISKALFDRVGGFPPVPLMEDVGMMAAIKKRGVRPLFLDRGLSSSPRRWKRRGVIRTTLVNWTLMFLYLMGVSEDRLARVYYPGRPFS